MKLSEYRAKRRQDPEYIAAKKALRWHFLIEDTRLAFSMWWQSRFDAGYEFGRAFFGWLRRHTRRHSRQQAPERTCSICNEPISTPCAQWIGEWEGWHVSWDCVNECGNELEMEWPFPDKLLVTSVDFEQAGFIISR